MKNKVIIFVLIVAMIVFAVVVFRSLSSGYDELKLSCDHGGGSWLDDYFECENINKDWCDEAGGKFNECASACRNNPDAKICIMQCVSVCKF